MKHISLIALAVALLPGLAMAATSVGTGDAKAKIVTPVSIAQDTNGELNFGTMTSEAGNVTVTPAGARSSTGQNLVTDSNTPSSGKLTVTGPANQQITVVLPTEATVSTSDNGGGSMTINTFTADKSGSQTIGAGGTLAIQVGGTLGVAADQTAGDYTGTYTITVNY